MLIMPWYVLSLYPSYLGIETNVLAIDTTTAVGRYLPLAFIALHDCSAGVHGCPAPSRRLR